MRSRGSGAPLIHKGRQKEDLGAMRPACVVRRRPVMPTLRTSSSLTIKLVTWTQAAEVDPGSFIVMSRISKGPEWATDALAPFCQCAAQLRHSPVSRHWIHERSGAKAATLNKAIAIGAF